MQQFQKIKHWYNNEYDGYVDVDPELKTCK